MTTLKLIFALLKETAVGYGRDRGGLLAAALAYHTVFSLAPLLVVSVAVAGFIFGEAAVTGELVTQISHVVGQETAVVIQNLIRNASEGSSGVVATAVSTVLLVYGASNVFRQLKSALNVIWGIVPGPDGGVLAMLKTRSLAVIMVMGIGFLLLSAQAASAVLAALGKELAAWVPGIGVILPHLNFFVTFLIITLLFAIIYKALPDATLAWRDAGVGAAFTALLFAIGQWIIGQYLARSSVGSAYGAASSLVILLFWIYISAQILLFGAEFTQEYANAYGGGVRPVAGAFLISRTPQQEEAAAAPPVYHPVPPAAPGAPPSQRQRWRPPLAAGLLGLAAGLFLGFLGSLMRER